MHEVSGFVDWGKERLIRESLLREAFMTQRVVLKQIDNPQYYDGWYISDQDSKPREYVIYDVPNQAKVLKMVGFELLWGDNPPPDELKHEIMRKYMPVPVKVVPLA